MRSAARLIDHGQELPTMTFKTPSRSRLAGLIAGVACALCLSFIAFDVALAEMAAPEPTVNKGDTAWMLSATIFVLLMTIPGLALFYGGLVRTKNMLSVLMWVFYSVCIVTVLWAVVGYSLAFTGGSTAYVGGFS
jgi:Amt family ammonium transporter